MTTQEKIDLGKKLLSRDHAIPAPNFSERQSCLVGKRVAVKKEAVKKEEPKVPGSDIAIDAPVSFVLRREMVTNMVGKGSASRADRPRGNLINPVNTDPVFRHL